MTIYEGLTLGFIVMGMIFIFLGFAINRTKLKVNEDEVAMEDEAFRKQINLVNEKVLELGDYHNFVKEEIEGKHKELLFLYQMISEKEKVIKDMQLVMNQYDRKDESKKEEDSLPSPSGPTNYNRKIIELKEKGYDAVEIAQLLGIGTGEVNLVLNLYE